MAFNARLDIAYSYIDNSPNELFISCAYVDNLGLYVGDNMGPGCRILQDVTGGGLPLDTLVYEIIENQGSQDGGLTFSLRAKWVLEEAPVELQSGYTTIVGAADVYGVVDVPEANSQMMDAIAVNRIRNYLSRLAKPTLTITNDNFTGVLDGANNVFTTEFSFKPESVKVFTNGMRLKEGALADYEVLGTNQIRTNFLPVEQDRMIIEYTR